VSGSAGAPAEERGAPDLRLLLLGAAAWAAALAGTRLDGAPRALAVAALAAGPAALLLRPRRRASPSSGAATAAALLVVLLGTATAASLRAEQVRADPVAGLAAEGAAVEVVLVVTSDPRRRPGEHDDVVLVRGRAVEVLGRGERHRVRAPVLVLARPGPWEQVDLGATVRTRAVLDRTDGGDAAALVLPAGEPDLLRAPGVAWRAAGAVRASLRAAVADRPPAQAVLVPALVVGDDAGLDPEVEQDFRTTGLTHLTAVSGTNLTLLLGALLPLARLVGVRGRGLLVVGVLGTAGFVLLARTEPSVVRAAVMGVVGLVALQAGGRRRGTRALGAAVVVLLLVDPWMAGRVGFALSVAATAGILLLAPVWRDALARWLPRPLAEAVAVPAAAQLACTPLVAAISGQVSLVAVLANLLVAPAVGPATVLGLAAGVVGLVSGTVAAWVGTPAAWCVGWLVVVAERGADLPRAAVGWGTGPWSLTLLVALCTLVALGARPLLRRPRWALAVAGVVALVVLASPGRVLPGVPWGGAPEDWALAACDVGQGDALVLAAGPGQGVVVDAGPDPRLVDRCLDRLGVRQVPLVVLTHFHADHVAGLAGVLDGRAVGAVEVSPVADPPGGVDLVAEVAAAAGVEVRTAPYAATRRVGDLVLQVLAPDPAAAPAATGDGGAANDASVVLLVEVDGLRILLTGDLEPPGQARFARAVGGLDVDVLKVPHHGSGHQDHGWLASLRAELAVVPVGEGNDYGHPAPSTTVPLERAGTRVVRTDESGTVLVSAGPDGPVVTTLR